MASIKVVPCCEKGVVRFLNSGRGRVKLTTRYVGVKVKRVPSREARVGTMVGTPPTGAARK